MLLLLSPVPFLCVLLVISRRNQNLVQNVKKLAPLPKIHQPAEVCYFGVKQYKPKVITEALAFLGDWQLHSFFWCQVGVFLGGGLNAFLFLPIFGEMIHI